jgi:hypothetical protein
MVQSRPIALMNRKKRFDLARDRAQGLGCIGVGRRLRKFTALNRRGAQPCCLFDEIYHLTAKLNGRSRFNFLFHDTRLFNCDKNLRRKQT